MKRTIKFLQLLLIGVIIIGCSNTKKTTSTTPREVPKPKETTNTATNKPVEDKEEIKDESTTPNYKPLIFNVKLNISPTRPNWVLFENGTYMLFKNPLGAAVLVPEAEKRLNDLIKKFPSTSQMIVAKSNLAKGWTVTLGTSGIYNYVAPEELANQPTDQQIKEKAATNVKRDQRLKNSIHVNQKK